MTRAIAGLAAAAVAVALAVWLEPASVQIVAWNASGPVRLAYLAPWRGLIAPLLVVGAIAIAVIVITRMKGQVVARVWPTAAPLILLLLWLVPYLPWLPDKAPLLLILSGPIRWVVAAMAVLGVALSFTTGKKTFHVRATRWAIFVISAALYVVLGVQYTRTAGFGGDEPHYLIIAQSLLADHDLDIANNHAQRDYQSFFPGELRPDFLQRGLHGEIYSIHAPGLPMLLLPAYAAAGPLGTVVFVAFLAALTALAIYDAAALLTNSGIATIVWLATCLTVPFVPHAWLLYPELPGALIVAWAVLWLIQPIPSVRRTALHGLVLATLPWLHTKFALLLLLFALFVTIRLWPRAKHIVALCVPIGVSSLAWLYSFYRMYGVLDPEAPYGSYIQRFVLNSNIPRGVLGLLFDQKFGLLMFSPAYVLAAVGAWMMLRDTKHRTYAMALLLTAGAFLASTTRLYMWWGGSSAPARFLVPAIPLLAPLMAVAVARTSSVTGRAIIAASIAFGLAVAIVTIGSTGESLLYSNPHGVSALVTFLQGSAPFDLALPTFTEENWRAPLGLLVRWIAAAGITGALIFACTRRGLLTSVFWTVASASIAFLVLASVFVGRSSFDRNIVVSRGQVATMIGFDPGRLRAVDLTRLRRLSDGEVLAASALSVRRAADAPADNPHVLEGPMVLPEGSYEARVWLERAGTLDADAFVAVSDHVVLARAEGPLDNPVVLPFDLVIRTPAFVGVSTSDAARAVRRIDIVPTRVMPRSERDPVTSHVVEPLGGSAGGYMAYLDDNAFPEEGVFWSRDTAQAGVMIATMGAASLKLVLHVGPSGGPVELDIDGHASTIDLGPDETREISTPIPPGTRRLSLKVRAQRSFRPSEADPKSSDQRRLGCQVRPLLY
ncbi:MAG TPA: hypothetical protein VH583_04195 [Vicinamibacterales bacterium]